MVGCEKCGIAVRLAASEVACVVIYYYFCEDQQLFFVYAYEKGRKDDLSPKELKILKKLLEED